MSIHVRTSKVFEAYASAYAKILVFIKFYVAGKNLRWLKIDLISWRRRTLSSLNIFPQSLYLRLNTFASKGAILLLISIADEIVHIFIVYVRRVNSLHTDFKLGFFSCANNIQIGEKNGMSSLFKQNKKGLKKYRLLFRKWNHWWKLRESRIVFRTLPNVCEEFFLLNTVNYFWKKLHHKCLTGF